MEQKPVEESAGDKGAPRVEPVPAETKVAASPATPASGHTAAKTIIEGTVTEETLALKKKLEDTEAKLKQREIEHASLTDEHERYKQATEARAVPINRGEIKPKTKPFRIGRFVG